MMTTPLPIDWDFAQENASSPPTDLTMSPVPEAPPHPFGSSQPAPPPTTQQPSSNHHNSSYRTTPVAVSGWKRNLRMPHPPLSLQPPLYHDRWSAVPNHGTAGYGGTGGSVWTPSSDPSSQHSRNSIWMDDQSYTSHGTTSYGAEFSAGGGNTSYGAYPRGPSLEESLDLSHSAPEPFDFGISQLSMQSGAAAPFRPQQQHYAAESHRQHHPGGSMLLEGSSPSYHQMASHGLPSGADSVSTAGGASIPSLMPASSGSTYGTGGSSLWESHSQASSVDLTPPPPPPGFHDSYGSDNNNKTRYNPNHPGGSRRNQHRNRGGGGNKSRRPSAPLGPLQETRNTTKTLHDSATSMTAEDSSVSSRQSIDISSSSEAIRQLMKPGSNHNNKLDANNNSGSHHSSGSSHRSLSEHSGVDELWTSQRLPPTLEDGGGGLLPAAPAHVPILPQHVPEDRSVSFHEDEDEDLTCREEDFCLEHEEVWTDKPTSPPASRKQEWLLRMNRKKQDCPVGEMDLAVIPLNAVMNGWAKSKSSQGAAMVEEWLMRAEKEFAAGNTAIVPTTKMYTMAVDAWARSGKGGVAAQRAEALLQQMYKMYQQGGNPSLKPTTGIFNAVINAWARSLEPLAPSRAEQILEWMDTLKDLDVRPDKYTFNTVIHAYSKTGGKEAATKAQDLLLRMQKMHKEGNVLAKADTITYNCVINCWAKSNRGGDAANEAEKLLNKMHRLYEMGDPDVKPNVVTYGAVIDAFAKSGQRGAASKADGLLANMIRSHQSDPFKHADLCPNTYVFNTVINCWSKSKERDAASKAEEMLVAMGRLHASGMTSLKPDAFTYTAVIDAWSKSFLRGAADRANLLLDKMETKYQAGDTDLKPNTFTYNAVINALAKSCEAGAAARAERVLQNMVNRHRNGGGDDVKPTTINFNTVLDAWAKSGGGRAASERAEEILEWMDRLCKQGNKDVAPDTISFNAVLDAWARSGDRNAPRRCEQILDHMDELYRAGNMGVKPDTYTYNTLINSWAKSSMQGAASRAEHVLQVMEKRYRDGDSDFKPNTRTYTSVIDAHAKSGERGAARRCESILNGMIQRYEAGGDEDSRPNVHTSNAVCNACAFSKHHEDCGEALQIAFRVFDWLSTQRDMQPDSYSFTILLSVCANLIPRTETATRYAHARSFFDKCREAGYVNDYVLRKLRQTVTEQEYLGMIDYRTDASASALPASWSRNTKPDAPSKQRKNKWNNNRRRN